MWLKLVSLVMESLGKPQVFSPNYLTPLERSPNNALFQGSQYRFVPAGIARIFRTGEQAGTRILLSRFILNTELFRIVPTFPANFGPSGRKIRFSPECNSSAT